VKRVAIAAALALGAILANTTGVAHADDVRVVGADGVEEYYYNEADCLADGPDVHVQVNDEQYSNFYCKVGDFGHWYLYFTDNPAPH
jgi:hypothetical protein